MRSLSLVVALAFAVSCLVQLSSADSDPAGTSCTKPRIRKPWIAYTDDEKTLYISAVSEGMKRGYHQKFVQLHTESSSEAEAHQTCMFIYWHRMFLLGYENMLRSLDPKYECVTIPYWDHLSGSAKSTAGTCSSIEDCSPIFQDFGGSKIGIDIDMQIYSVTVRDDTTTKCITQPPLSSFCGNNTGCAGCVLRGMAYKNKYPTEATFGSVYKQVFTYSQWTMASTSIERGVHNTVHGTIGGIMNFLQSPIDPVFYTHHALIDLLQAIYLKCQLNSETATLTAKQKGSDSRFWPTCNRRRTNAATPFKNTDTITMMTTDYGGKWVHVRTNPNNILYPFFKDLPAKFADYVDAKDLGVYSYTYQMQGALGNMYKNCKLSNTITAASLLSDEELGHKDDTSDDLVPIVKGPTAIDLKTRLWTIAVYEAAKLAGYTTEAARDQMELMLCYHSDECLGGVSDYAEQFRENFGVTGHPRCYTLLEQLKAGKLVIGVPEWHDISSKFLPCPVPKLNADGTVHHHHADDDDATATS